MWPLIKPSRQLVAMTITPEAATLCWFSPETKKKHSRINLHAFSITTFENLECIDGLLFNPATLHTHLTKFLAAHALSAPTIVCALAGNGIQEKIVTLPTAKPTEKDFSHILENTTLWDYLYLHPNDGKFSYYVCGINRKQLAQHTAFAACYGHNITMLTTASAALLALYRNIHGAAFRYSKLAHDLAACNNAIESLNTIQAVRPFVTMMTAVPDSEYAHILPGLGMAYTFFGEHA